MKMGPKSSHDIIFLWRYQEEEGKEQITIILKNKKP